MCTKREPQHRFCKECPRKKFTKKKTVKNSGNSCVYGVPTKQSFKKFDFQRGNFLDRISRAPVLYMLDTVLQTFSLRASSLSWYLFCCNSSSLPLIPHPYIKDGCDFFIPWLPRPRQEPSSRPSNSHVAFRAHSQ